MSSSPSNSTETSPPPPSPSLTSSSPPPPPSPDSNSKSPSPPPPPSFSPPPPPPSPPPNDNSSRNNNTSTPPPNYNSSGNNNTPPPPPSPNNNNSNNSTNNKSPPPPPPWKSPPPASPPPPPPPPPTPYRYGSIPPPSSASWDDYSSPNQKTMMIGAAAGAGLLLLLMIVFLASCGRRRKRKPHDHMKYYRDHSHGNQSNDFYSNQNWITGQPSDHAMRVPPALNSAQVSSELNWPIGPPPPPPMMTSSELKSNGFSGPHQPTNLQLSPSLTFGFNQSKFTYDDLTVATGGFAKSNLLGQGGFGYVHKGVLPNGKEVAVKSLKANSGQGEREFQAEVDIISRVHHRHLVSLVGYCIAGSQRMLVYEYMPNGSLEHHLYGADVPAMNWNVRLKIALGSAKGFAYLHEDCHPRIIHRDIKASNILLDFDYEAKVSDFGLAKLSSDNYTHVSTRIMGTFGYMAPEYASSGKLTDKSDVYSFGVMLLELITGRRPIDVTCDDDGLVDWARPILVQVIEGGGSYEELVDPRLGNNYDPQEMLRMVVSAAACIRHSARRRPKMRQILHALEGDASLDDLNDNIRTENSSMSRSGSDYDNGSYSDLKNFRKAGTMSSREFMSSEHGHTGELVN